MYEMSRFYELLIKSLDNIKFHYVKINILIRYRQKYFTGECIVYTFLQIVIYLCTYIPCLIHGNSGVSSYHNLYI